MCWCNGYVWAYSSLFSELAYFSTSVTPLVPMGVCVSLLTVSLMVWSTGILPKGFCLPNWTENPPFSCWTWTSGWSIVWSFWHSKRRGNDCSWSCSTWNTKEEHHEWHPDEEASYPPLKILSYEEVSWPCQCTTSKTVPKAPRQTVGMKDSNRTDQTRARPGFWTMLLGFSWVDDWVKLTNSKRMSSNKHCYSASWFLWSQSRKSFQASLLSALYKSLWRRTPRFYCWPS